MTPAPKVRPARPASERNVTERRLLAGEVVMKTMSPEAKHGAFWTYVETGHLAAAKVCHRFERLGLLETRDALFPGCSGQTYRLKPGPTPTRPRKAAQTPQEANP